MATERKIYVSRSRYTTLRTGETLILNMGSKYESSIEAVLCIYLVVSVFILQLVCTASAGAYKADCEL